MNNNAKFEDLKGETLLSISGGEGDDEMVFITESGREYKMYHYQDCCESVSIEDICGDISDLIGSPIIKASEDSNSDNTPDGVEEPRYQDESFTWTFYNIATAKGHVTIRWYGSSNGYYSECVDFCRVK